MKVGGENRKKKKNFKNVIIIFLVFSVLYGTIFLFQSTKDYFQKIQEKEDLLKKINKTENILRQKEIELSYKKTDEYLEVQVRKNYLLKKNNEIVVAEPNILNTKEDTKWREDESKNVKKVSNWRKWFELFFYD